uniref:FRIGIDA-like protein n=1 Tax=Kalanchoe fedtschenkoi TaxID=63787 RepID=A0A7N0UFX3_KALFE
MIKCGMRVEAAYIAYIFGLTEKFQPHAILTMHLKESKDSCDRKKREAKAFPQRAKEATEKHLATMKSIVACLEYHEVDPSKLLPDWQIKGMIVKAEKDIAGYCKKIEAKASQKRKVEGIESHQKRQRYTAEPHSDLTSSLGCMMEGLLSLAWINTILMTCAAGLWDNIPGIVEKS